MQKCDFHINPTLLKETQNESQEKKCKAMNILEENRRKVFWPKKLGQRFLNLITKIQANKQGFTKLFYNKHYAYKIINFIILFYRRHLSWVRLCIPVISVPRRWREIRSSSPTLATQVAQSQFKATNGKHTFSSLVFSICKESSEVNKNTNNPSQTGQGGHGIS